jgi:hypothetical protein
MKMRSLMACAALSMTSLLLAVPVSAQYYPPAYRISPPAPIADDDVVSGSLPDEDEALPGVSLPPRGLDRPGGLPAERQYGRQMPTYSAEPEVYRAPLEQPEPGRAAPGEPMLLQPGPGRQLGAAPYGDPVPPRESYPPQPGYGRQIGAPAGDSGPPRPPGGIASQPPGAGPIPPEPTVLAALPPEDQPEVGEPKQLAPHLRRQLVDFATKEPAGTIVIDTPNTYLYLILGNGKAMRYGIGVGRDGFTWNGVERVSRMAEWPDWHPPEEMVERQPYLPRFMAGGPGNPMGARALYLGKTLYRIHGTNQP